MVNQMIPLSIGTAIYAVLFLFLPCFIPKGPNQGIIRCSIYLSVFSMWIFWATVYIAQMNPLIGPRHKNTTLIWLKHAEEKSNTGSGDGNSNNRSIAATRTRRFEHCRNITDNLYECCNIPWVPAGVMTKCIEQPVNVLKLTCQEAKCVFREADWSDGHYILRKYQIESFYDSLLQKDRDWADAVQLIKTECVTHPPRYQGIYMNCIEFDILYCTMKTMFRHGPIENWSTAAACSAARDNVATCPLCPDQCRKISLGDSAACRACSTF